LIPVYIEAGAKRAFALALDWPGWARSGKTEADALASLAAAGARYAAAVGEDEPATATDPGIFEVTERLPGNAATDFGAPSAVPAADATPLTGAELARWIARLERSWAALDRAAVNAEGRELRKGPRGGGRELAKILEHVTAAEIGYLSRIGVRYRGTDAAELRRTVIATLQGGPAGRWPPRYFIRRAAWHVLDHAWEIEDRMT
jgi:hypothetical protein